MVRRSCSRGWRICRAPSTAGTKQAFCSPQLQCRQTVLASFAWCTRPPKIEIRSSPSGFPEPCGERICFVAAWRSYFVPAQAKTILAKTVHLILIRLPYSIGQCEQVERKGKSACNAALGKLASLPPAGRAGHGSPKQPDAQQPSHSILVCSSSSFNSVPKRSTISYLFVLKR